MLVEALQYFKTQCYLGMISEYFTYNIYNLLFYYRFISRLHILKHSIKMQQIFSYYGMRNNSNFQQLLAARKIVIYCWM